MFMATHKGSSEVDRATITHTDNQSIKKQVTDLALFVLFLGIVGMVLYPIFDNARKEAGADQSENLQQCGLALLQYAQDYDQKLPPFTSDASVASALDPYLYNRRKLIDPWSERTLAWRTELSELNLGTTTNSKEIIVAHSPISVRQKRMTLYLDGHVHFLSEQKFRSGLSIAPKHKHF